MNVGIVPTHISTVAEISGVDLSQPLPNPVFVQIEAAFNQYGVIFFRDQSITPTQQVAFSRRFGEMEFNYNNELWGLKAHPEIFIVSNIEVGGKLIDSKRVGERWRNDMCYTSNPPRATMLHAIEIPVLHGLTLGDTAFANAALAWEALPRHMQEKIERQSVIFDFRARHRPYPPGEEVARRYPPVLHPIVRAHPGDGKKIALRYAG